MELPKNAGDIAAKFPDLTEERKNQIIAHLAQTPSTRGNKTVDTLIENGGVEGRFVAALFGKTAPGSKDSPQNKALGSVHKK